MTSFTDRLVSDGLLKEVKFQYKPCRSTMMTSVTFPVDIADGRLHRLLIVVIDNHFELHADGNIYSETLQSSCISDCVGPSSACAISIGGLFTGENDILYGFVGTIVELLVYPIARLSHHPGVESIEDDTTTTPKSTTRIHDQNHSSKTLRNNTMFHRVFTSSKPTLAFIEGLWPSFSYTCRLRVSNTHGSRSGTSLTLQTKFAPPFGVGRPFVDVLGPNHARVQWLTPTEPNGLPAFFNISVLDLTSNHLVASRDLISNDRTWQLVDLTAYTVYNVSMIVWNSAGEVPLQPVSFRTMASVPTRVSLPFLVSVNARSVLVNITTVADANGPTLEYLFINTELCSQRDRLNSTTNKTKNHFNGTHMHISDTDILIAHLQVESSIETIPSLTPATSYCLRVVVSNGILNTTAPGFLVFETKESSPEQQLPPLVKPGIRHLTVTNISPPLLPNGEIITFQLWLNNDLYLSFNQSERSSVIIGNLSPNTNYNVSLVSCTIIGCSEPANTLVVTLPDVPGGVVPPSLVQVYETSLALQIYPPREPNGAILGYTISLTHTQGCVRGDPIGCMLSSCKRNEHVCGRVCFNPITHVCCGSVVIYTRASNHTCCGSAYLDLAMTSSVCCGGMTTVRRTNFVCCGGRYLPAHLDSICCEGVLSTGSRCCGSQGYADDDSQICCGTSLFDKLASRKCCGNSVIPVAAACCEGVSHLLIDNQVCCGKQAVSQLSGLCCYAGGSTDRYFSHAYPVGVKNVGSGYLFHNKTALLHVANDTSIASCCNGNAIDETRFTCATSLTEVVDNDLKKLRCVLPSTVCDASLNSSLSACGHCVFNSQQHQCLVTDPTQLSSCLTRHSVEIQEKINEEVNQFGRQMVQERCTSTTPTVTLHITPDRIQDPFIVKGLLPASSYHLDMTVTGEVGSLQASSVLVHTAESIPDGVLPPVPVAATSNRIWVHVHRALREHAYVVYYFLIIQPFGENIVNDTAIRIPVSEGQQNASAQPFSPVFHDTRVNVNNSFFSPSVPVLVTVDRLQPFTKYMLWTKACTRQLFDRCSWSLPSNVTTHQSAPPTASSVFFTAISSHSLTFSWNITPVVEQHGPISFHRITTQWMQHDVDLNRSDSSWPRLSFTLKGLTPFTQVNIKFFQCTISGCVVRHLSQHTTPANAKGLALLQATALESRFITLRWRPPSLPNGIVEAYSIYRDGVLLTSLPASNLSYNDTSVGPFERYSYHYSVVNSAGESNPSEPVTLQTPPSVPAFPSVATLTFVSETVVGLTWEPPERPNDASISYRVYLAQGVPRNSTDNLGQIIFEGYTQVHEVAGLIPYTQYYFIVAAVNSAGFSVPTTMGDVGMEVPIWTSAHTSESLPLGVQEPVVLPLSPFTVEVRARVPELPRGKISLYTIEGRAVRSQWPLQPVMLAQESFAMTFIHKNLTAFTVYEYRVLIQNGAGTTASPWGQVRTCTSRPSKPMRISVHDISSQEARLLWQAPNHINGPVNTLTYNVILDHKVTSTDVVRVRSWKTSQNERGLTELSGFTTYKVTLLACVEQLNCGTLAKDVNTSLCSTDEESLVFTTLSTAPSGLQPLLAIPVNPFSIHISWQAPTNPNGPTLHYRLIRNSTVLLDFGDGSEKTFIDADIIPGLTYVYTLALRTSGGESFVHSKPVATQPRAPEGVGKPEVDLMAREDGILGRFCWNVPTEPNGLIVLYRLHLNDDIVKIGSSKLCVSVLMEFDAVHHAFVEACTGNGGGCTAGENAVFVTPCSIASPVVPERMANNSTSISVRWLEPTNPRCNIVTYEVNISGPGLSAGSHAASTSEREYVFTDLQPASTYHVHVTSITRVGYRQGPVVAMETQVAAPVGINLPTVVIMSNTSVLVTWQMPTRANAPLPSLSFRVYMNDTILDILPSSVFSIFVRNLYPSTTYSFFVEACTSGGCTSSAKQIATTPDGVPVGVTRPTVSDVADRSFSVTWVPPIRTAGVITFLAIEVDRCTNINVSCFDFYQSLDEQVTDVFARNTIMISDSKTFVKVNKTIALPSTYHRARVVYGTSAGKTRRFVFFLFEKILI